MSKKGKSNSHRKKHEENSNDINGKSTSMNSEDDRRDENSNRPRKKYLCRLIFKNKNCISYGLHTRIFKVHSFTYKGKKYIYYF